MKIRRRRGKKTTTPVIGLIGGVASGKSFIGKILVELGCTSINADKVGHELLESLMIKLQLRKTFGDGIFCQDGSVDRNRLGGIVFGDDLHAKKNLQQLNSIMHPAIRATIVREIIRLKQSQPPPVAIVLDAALLLEANWDKACDWIFFVDTPESIRIQRAASRGWPESHWRVRELAQIPLEEKKKSATHFINGELDEKNLRIKLDRILTELTVSE